jgi:hypothetical protein
MGIKNIIPIAIGIKLKRFKHIFFFIVLYFVFLVFFSCAYKKEVPPPLDLIEESEMAKVITDITLSEAILTNEPLASLNDSIKKINILKEHGVSSQQFLSSMKYYSENPEKLQGIYLEVSDIIASKQNVVDTIAKK